MPQRGKGCDRSEQVGDKFVLNIFFGFLHCMTPVRPVQTIADRVAKRSPPRKLANSDEMGISTNLTAKRVFQSQVAIMPSHCFCKCRGCARSDFPLPFDVVNK